MKSFSFEDKDPKFTRLEPVLALRLLSKGLFYIRAMVPTNFKIVPLGLQPSNFFSTARKRGLPGLIM